MKSGSLACIVAVLLLSPAVLAEELHCPPSLEEPLPEAVPGETLLLPRGNLFQPLIADPSEPRFSLGYRYYERPGQDMHIGVVGLGETFPLWRKVGRCTSDGVQLDVLGGGNARFDMDDARNDLIDADYSIGLALSGRQDVWSWRARLYHRSSHLGEDTLFEGASVRYYKVYFDSVALLASYDMNPWRFYGGVEHVFNHYPAFNPNGIQAGAEYYGEPVLFNGQGRWVGALDIKAWAQHDLRPDYSLKAGLSLGGTRRGQQNMQLLLEFYEGYARNGVFFEEKLRYWGVGIYFGF